MEPGELFLEAQRRAAGALLAAADMHRGRAWYRARQLLASWPVQLHGDDRWVPLPERNALPGEERLLLAVRAGPVDWSRIPGMVPGVLPGLWADGQAWRVRGWRAVWGPEVVDLIALPPPGRRDRWRFLVGGTAALGDPFGDLADAYGPEAEEPVPVARGLRGWLAGAMRGAILPLGDDWTKAAYLRRLSMPLIAEDLAHGLALERFLKRTERLMPEIRVPAAKAGAA